MTDCDDLNDDFYGSMIDFQRKGGFKRERFLFSIFCALQIVAFMHNNESINALFVSEKFYNGKASEVDFLGAKGDADEVFSLDKEELARKYRQSFCAADTSVFGDRGLGFCEKMIKRDEDIEKKRDEFEKSVKASEAAVLACDGEMCDVAWLVIEVFPESKAFILEEFNRMVRCIESNQIYELNMYRESSKK